MNLVKIGTLTFLRVQIKLKYIWACAAKPCYNESTERFG